MLDDREERKRLTPEERIEARRQIGVRYYQKHKTRILALQKAEYRKLHPDTPAEHEASHRRRSSASKRAWKKRAPATRGKLLANLEAGRQVRRVALSKDADQRRREWQWEAIKLRLSGVSFADVVERFREFGCSEKTLFTLLDKAGIPKRKKAFYDRGQPFTRFSGTNLLTTLGYSAPEFAARIKVRRRRPSIWLTSPEKSLEQSEARRCVDVRNDVASLLSLK